MTLNYGTLSNDIQDIKDRLSDLSLAYNIKTDFKIIEPTLFDGRQYFEGIKAINNYIDQLEREQQNWFYCNC